MSKCPTCNSEIDEETCVSDEDGIYYCFGCDWFNWPDE